MKFQRRVTELVGAFCPIPPMLLLRKRFASGKARSTPLIGLEKRCPRCNEFWPADTEFFYSVPSKRDGLNDWCKACYREWCDARDAQAAAA